MFDCNIYKRRVLAWLAITSGFILSASAVGQSAVYQPYAAGARNVRGYDKGRLAGNHYYNSVQSGVNAYRNNRSYQKPYSSTAPYNITGIDLGSATQTHSYGSAVYCGAYSIGKPDDVKRTSLYATAGSNIGYTTISHGRIVTRSEDSFLQTAVQLPSDISKRREYGGGDDEEDPDDPNAPDGDGTMFGEKRQGKDGTWYTWNGSSWARLGTEASTPVGNIPWLLLMVCMLVYKYSTGRRRKKWYSM